MLNPFFHQLKREYIFPIIEKKLSELQEHFPQVKPLNLGIGDIAKPLCPSIANAICKATLEMTTEEHLRGYGPHHGYLFLREALAHKYFEPFGITPDEIFISDGINSDAVGIQDLFDTSCAVGILDPTYPAYLDATILSGKTHISLLPCTEENGFCPLPPSQHLDVIYLCSPSNPTGVAMTKKILEKWVSYAERENAVLLFDHAYSGFITSSDVPKTIYEIPNAKNCAIEFHSFSKTAGFTGLRCAYAIVPKTLKRPLKGGALTSLHTLWDRRQAAKFNGVAYPIQKGALAALSSQGERETQAQVKSYLEQASELKRGLCSLGFTCYGGIDSPYIWWKTPNAMKSWDFFDLLLKKCHLISIPGTGFGASGEGYVRLSSFILPETTQKALQAITKI